MKRPWIFLGLLVLLLVIYGRAVSGNDFVDWDDYLLIRDNPIAHSMNPETIGKAFSTFDPELYIPLTFLSYQIDWMIGDGSPVMFHLTNLLLHAVNAFLVFLFIEAFSRKRGVALAVAFLFAVHPLHTEAVVWASSRKDLFSAAFFLLSLVLYLRYQESGSRKAFIGSITSHLFALLSKVIAVTQPIVLLLLDWSENRKFDREALVEKLPYFALSVIFGIVAMFGKAGGNSALLWEKFLIACKAIVFYLWKLFIPTGLSVLYPYTKPIDVMTPDLGLSVLGIIAITVVIFLYRKKSRSLVFAWLFFLITLAPTFTNFAKSGGALLDVYFASDRYAYIPSIALLFVVVLGADALIRKFGFGKRFSLVSVAVVCVVFSILSFRQSQTWKDTGTLFLHALKHYPNSQIAHSNIGALLYRAGQVDAAIAEFDASLAIRPTETTYFNLGRAYMQKGLIAEGIAAYRKSLEVNPNYSDSLINLGAFLMGQGNNAEAAELFERAVAVNDKPTVQTATYNLAVAYENLGRIEEAIAMYEKAYALDPKDLEAKARADALR